MGVWALVLAILPLFITWLVSIGLAVAVLLRPDDGWRRGRGPAIAALAISAAWILVLTGMVIVGSALPEPDTAPAATSKSDSDRQPAPVKAPPSREVKTHALEVGDCLRMVPDNLDVTVKVTSCRVVHRAEVYAVFSLADGPFRNVDKVNRLAEVGCLKRFKPFIGHGYYWSDLEFTYLMPDEAAWHKHSRSVTCAVFEYDSPTTGTLRGSAG